MNYEPNHTPSPNPAVAFPFASVLGLIFITLKLCGIIDWSWWWVLSPFWGGFLLLLLLIGMVYAIPLGVVAISLFLAYLRSKKNQ